MHFNSHWFKTKINIAPARKSDFDWLVLITFDQSTIRMRRSLVKRLSNWERASEEVQTDPEVRMVDRSTTKVMLPSHQATKI